MKTWKPDTCDCVVEELYNGTEITGGGQVIRKCEDHQGVPDDELYGVLYANPDGENKRKNLVEKHLLETPGLGLAETKVNPDGSTRLGYKDGIRYSWAWTGTDKNRVLQVDILGTSLTPANKNAIRAFADARFGAGKVNVQ